MQITPNDIKQALQSELPGAVSHKKMLPPNRDLEVPANFSEIKQSSVILLLFTDRGVVKACLIKRPTHMKNHAGQIALPGGRIEKNETALETALRETTEEIGVAAHSIEILGKLSPLFVAVSGFMIHPFVGWINQKPVFKLQQQEVEKVLLFPLFNFRNKTEETEINTVTGLLKVPCIKFENEIIWGATAMILAEFYDII